jgi:hypothetical protein
MPRSRKRNPPRRGEELGLSRVWIWVGLVGGLAAIAGCDVKPGMFTDGLPLVTVQHAPDGTETVMTGRILPKMNYSSTFALSAEGGSTCSGSFTSTGNGAMTCSDGLSIDISVPSDQYGRTTGAYLVENGGIGVAVGWGDKADAALLRAMFQGSHQ